MKEEEEKSIESRVQQAMRSRVQHFKDLADSLTFEGVRRLLEKDLALDTYALDKHKKYVKQLLEKLMNGTEDDDNVSKQVKSEKINKEEEEQLKEQKVTDDDEEKIDDSPVMGLLSGNKSAKSENTKTQDKLKDKIPTEDMIKEAIWKKATYFQSKSEELTVAGVRRLIEEDLELEKFSLDPFKKLISKQLDEVLNSQNETPNKTGSKPDADSSHSESEDEVVEAKPKKKPAPKTKVQKAEAPKKRKKPAQETEQPKKKKTKNAEETSVRKKNIKDADEDSSAKKSESSAEKSESSAGKSEKKEVVAPVYGKKVERLKSIIKACGMSVAPTVYRKAKQAPEDKREAILVKELKEILAKEGLSANPSEKEIKEVKRRKERAKELEGIDTSNIVMGSRSRRSTFNFVPPPKPKAAVESDDDESEESGNDNSDDTDNEDGDGDDQEVDDKDGDDEDEDDGDDKNDDDQEADDKDGDDDDDKVGDDKDEDDTVHDSKSEVMTGNDETV